MEVVLRGRKEVEVESQRLPAQRHDVTVVIDDGGRGAAVAVAVIVAVEYARGWRGVDLLPKDPRPYVDRRRRGGVPRAAEGLHGATVTAGRRPLRGRRRVVLMLVIEREVGGGGGERCRGEGGR